MTRDPKSKRKKERDYGLAKPGEVVDQILEGRWRDVMHNGLILDGPHFPLEKFQRIGKKLNPANRTTKTRNGRTIPKEE